MGLRLCNAAGALLDPAEVAGHVVEGLRQERFLILPHPQVRELLQAKAADHAVWLAGMRGLRAEAVARLG